MFSFGLGLFVMG